MIFGSCVPCVAYCPRRTRSGPSCCRPFFVGVGSGWLAIDISPLASSYIGASADRAASFAGKHVVQVFSQVLGTKRTLRVCARIEGRGRPSQGPSGLGSQRQAAGVAMGTSVAGVGQSRSGIEEPELTQRATPTPTTGITPACRMDRTELMAC